MKRILTLIFYSMLLTGAYSQSEGGDFTTNSYRLDQSNLTSSRVSFLNNDSVLQDMTYQSNDLYRQALLLNPSLRNNPLMSNYDNRQRYSLGSLNLSSYNQRVLNIGLGDLNNIGASLQWQPLNRLSIEASGFVSMQYGYTLFSRNTAYGANLRFNYNVTDKLRFNVWGQYILHQNNDPFMRYMDSQSKTGVSIGLEYTPSDKVTFSIDVSKQEDIIDKKKFDVVVEGKAGFKF